MRIFKLQLTENVHPNISHRYGVSTSCLCMCVFKLEQSENADPHTVKKIRTQQRVFTCVLKLKF